MIALIIDDSPTSLRQTEKGLTKAGYKVFCAKDELQARQVLANNNVQVAVIDKNLGNTSGIDLIRKMRDQLPECVILYSGDSDEATRTAAIEAGAVAVVAKGDFEALKSALTKHSAAAVTKNGTTGTAAPTAPISDDTPDERRLRNLSVVRDEGLRDSIKTLEKRMEIVEKRLDRRNPDHLRDDIDHIKRDISALQMNVNNFSRLDQTFSSRFDSINQRIKEITSLRDRISYVENLIKRNKTSFASDTPSHSGVPANNLDRKLIDAIVQEAVDARFHDAASRLEKLTENRDTNTNVSQPNAALDAEIESLKNAIEEIKASRFAATEQEKQLVELRKLAETATNKADEAKASLDASIEKHIEQLAAHAETLTQSLDAKISTVQAEIDAMTRSRAETIAREILDQTTASLDANIQKVVDQMTRPGGGIATENDMRHLIQTEIERKYEFFRELVSETEHQFSDRVRRGIDEARDSFRVPDEQLQNAIRDVAKRGLAERVQRMIAGDMADLAREEAAATLGAAVQRAAIAGGLIGAVIAVVTVYFLWVA